MTDLLDRIHIDVGGSDVDSAREALCAAWAGLQIRSLEGGADFSFRYAAAGTPAMTVRALRFDGRCEGRMPSGDDYVVTWLGRGNGTVDDGRKPVHLQPGRPQMWPNDAFDFSFERWDQRLVQVSRRAVAEILAERGQSSDGLRFDHSAAPTDDGLRQWRHTVSLISKTVLDRTASPVLQTEMSRIAASALLELFPVVANDLPPDLLLPRNAHIRSAVEYAHEHAHLPITSSDLAAVANVSVRRLQQAFVRLLDSTPNAYLRDLRLSRVHDELRRSDPASTSVAEVARRWGFAHGGRFAATYAERFGCYPSVTLSGR